MRLELITISLLGLKISECSRSKKDNRELDEPKVKTRSPESMIQDPHFLPRSAFQFGYSDRRLASRAQGNDDRARKCALFAFIPLICVPESFYPPMAPVAYAQLPQSQAAPLQFPQAFLNRGQANYLHPTRTNSMALNFPPTSQNYFMGNQHTPASSLRLPVHGPAPASLYQNFMLRPITLFPQRLPPGAPIGSLFSPSQSKLVRPHMSFPVPFSPLLGLPLPQGISTFSSPTRNGHGEPAINHLPKLNLEKFLPVLPPHIGRGNSLFNQITGISPQTTNSSKEQEMEKNKSKIVSTSENHSNIVGRPVHFVGGQYLSPMLADRLKDNTRAEVIKQAQSNGQNEEESNEFVNGQWTKYLSPRIDSLPDKVTVYENIATTDEYEDETITIPGTISPKDPGSPNPLNILGRRSPSDNLLGILGDSLSSPSFSLIENESPATESTSSLPSHNEDILDTLSTGTDRLSSPIDTQNEEKVTGFDSNTEQQPSLARSTGLKYVDAIVLDSPGPETSSDQSSIKAENSSTSLESHNQDILNPLTTLVDTTVTQNKARITKFDSTINPPTSPAQSTGLKDVDVKVFDSPDPETSSDQSSIKAESSSTSLESHDQDTTENQNEARITAFDSNINPPPSSAQSRGLKDVDAKVLNSPSTEVSSDQSSTRAGSSLVKWETRDTLLRFTQGITYPQTDSSSSLPESNIGDSTMSTPFTPLMSTGSDDYITNNNVLVSKISEDENFIVRKLNGDELMGKVTNFTDSPDLTGSSPLYVNEGRDENDILQSLTSTEESSTAQRPASTESDNVHIMYSNFTSPKEGLHNVTIVDSDYYYDVDSNGENPYKPNTTIPDEEITDSPSLNLAPLSDLPDPHSNNFLILFLHNSSILNDFLNDGSYFTLLSSTSHLGMPADTINYLNFTNGVGVFSKSNANPSTEFILTRQQLENGTFFVELDGRKFPVSVKLFCDNCSIEASKPLYLTPKYIIFRGKIANGKDDKLVPESFHFILNTN